MEMQCDSVVLLGFAVDVSGSMQRSLRRERDRPPGTPDSQEKSRIQSIQTAVDKAVEEARTVMQRSHTPSSGGAIRTFAYGFGLQVPGHEVCDLLSLWRSSARGILTEEHTESQEMPPGDGYNNLAQVASLYDYEREMMIYAKKYLNSRDAALLAEELTADSVAAQKLSKLIPKSRKRAMMKYGRQKTMKKTVKKIAPWASDHWAPDHFEKARNLIIELISRRGANDVEATRNRLISENMNRVIDGLNEVGETTLSIEELVDFWSSAQDSDENLMAARMLLFGITPMCRTLEIVCSRFERERRQLPPDTRAFLFILSDGGPTDGDPTSLADVLKRSGVVIHSCFVTDLDVTQPRELVGEKSIEWSYGARLMFDMASTCDSSSELVQFLKDLSWCSF